MLAWIKKASIAGIAAIALTAATIGTSVPANAQRFHGGFGGFHGGWHGGGWGGGWRGGGWRGGGWGWGPALGAGLALGAVAAAGPWGWGCGPVRRVVGFDPWGRPIVRWIDRCW